jgi:glucan phosphoethanolaminetransferase (alkaline phosphatase superfamily)
MTHTQIDNTLQWAGTACFLCMYTLMSLNMYPWNIVAGVLGGALYLAWSIRTRNIPQTVTNVVSIAICTVGLYKAFG